MATAELVHEMRVMGKREGDIKLRWKAGDATEIALAKAAFDKAMAQVGANGKKLFRAYKADAAGKRDGEPITEFDPAHERIVIAAALVGG